MKEITLPITSIFEGKEEKKRNYLYKYNFKVCNKTARVFTEYLSNNPKIEYKHDWITCFEPEDHLDDLNEIISKENSKRKEAIIYGYSFKDDSLLERIKKVSLKKNLNYKIKKSKELGLPQKGACLNKLINFSKSSNFKKISEDEGKCDILIMRHVIEHFWNLEEALQAVKFLLKEDGYIIFEVPDCEEAFKNNQTTIIWEEHFSYFTKKTLYSTLIFNGFIVEKTLRYKNGLEDSLIFFSKPSTKNNLPKEKLSNLVIENKKIIKNFFNDIYEKKRYLKNLFKSIKDNKIILFGAGHHASTFVNFNECENFIDFVIDDNINKQNKYLSGTNLMIFRKAILKDLTNPHIFLTTNPENQSSINKKILELNPSAKIFSIFSI